MASQTLTIRRPDDWHVHLRDGEMLKRGRALHRAAVRAGDRHAQSGAAGDQRRSRARYRDRIVAAAGAGFTPLMTCYLTDEADPDELARGFDEGVWIAAKLYPAGATTNSASGVTDIAQHLSGARADAGDRHGAVRPRRSDRPGRRRVRPRGGVHRRACSTPLIARLPGAQDRASSISRPRKRRDFVRTSGRPSRRRSRRSI